MNKAIKALCIVIAILLFSGGAAISQEKEPIVVGSIFDQVGFGAELGQGCLRGAQLAVKLVNEAGGIHGHPVKYTNIDAQSDLDLIVSAAMRLTEEMNVVAAAGGEDDSLTNAAGPVFQAHKTVYLTGAVTVPTCTQMGDYIFMVCYGDHFQGSAGAKYCVEKLGWKKIAVLYDAASAYSTYLTHAYMHAFRHFTGDPNAVVLVESYQTGDVVFTAQLTRIRKVQDQVDGLVAFPPEPQDAPTYMKQARKLGINLTFFSGDGADDISLVEVGGKDVEGSYISTHFAGEHQTTAVGKKFVEEYKKLKNEAPGGFEAIGHDSMRLIFESIGHIIDMVGDDVWNSMSLEQKRTAIRNTLQNWPTFTSTTVPIEYPPAETAVYPRCPDRPVIIKTIKDGKMVYAAHLTSDDFKDDLPAILEAIQKDTKK